MIIITYVIRLDFINLIVTHCQIQNKKLRCNSDTRERISS